LSNVFAWIQGVCSVGGGRKHEFQWMSLALVADRKGIYPQKFCTNYDSWNALSLHSSSFTAIPLQSERWEKEDYGEGE